MYPSIARLRITSYHFPFTDKYPKTAEPHVKHSKMIAQDLPKFKIIYLS